MTVGATTWVISDGFIPAGSTGPEPAMTSHDSACILNAGERDARVEEAHARVTQALGVLGLQVPAGHQPLDPGVPPAAVEQVAHLDTYGNRAWLGR